MIKYKNKSFICHLDLAVEHIKGKWKSNILYHLDIKPKRFLELQRDVRGISHKVLNEKLNQLIEDDLVFKTVYPEIPPRVEYALTEKGEDLYPLLHSLTKWSEKHNKDK